MKRKPRWTLEMLTASLAVLCGLLLLVLLVQRPTAWLLLAVLVVLWGIGATLFRCKLRRWVVRWTSGTTFEKSKVQFSLEPLSQPAALLSGETVLWYNSQFRTRLLGGQDVLASRVQKLLPGLDLQLCRKREGQLLPLADGYWSVHSSGMSSSVPLTGTPWMVWFSFCLLYTSLQCIFHNALGTVHQALILAHIHEAPAYQSWPGQHLAGLAVHGKMCIRDRCRTFPA